MNVYAQIKWNDLSSIYITFFVVDFFSILATLGLQAKNFISLQLPITSSLEAAHINLCFPQKKVTTNPKKKFIYNLLIKYELKNIFPK